MDVLQNVLKSAQNRSRRSYDDGMIQKIAQRSTTTTPRPRFHRIEDLSKYYIEKFKNDGFFTAQAPFEPDDFWLKHQPRPGEGFPWRDLSQSTRNHNIPTHNTPVFIDFKFPEWKLPKIDLEGSLPKRPIATTSLIVSAVLFFIYVAIRFCVYCHEYKAPDDYYRQQRRLSTEQQLAAGRDTESQSNGETDSVTLSVHSETSHSLADLPPAYSECAARNDGVINKNLDLTSEELPPPYSICIGTIGNADIVKVNKKTSTEGEPHSPDTDSPQNNVTEASLSIDVGQNNSDVQLSRRNNSEIRETTININELHTDQRRTTQENERL